MKRTISILIIVAMLFTAFAAGCSNDTAQDGHTLYVQDGFNSEKLTATFSKGDKTETKELTKDESSDDIYFTSADPEEYDRVVITADGDDSMELAFNEFVSGYKLSADGVMPFTYGEEEAAVTYMSETLPYGDSTKEIAVWSPADYDESKKYSVIYMTDGQNLFDDTATVHGSWGVAQSVMSMMKNSSNRAIVVGVYNDDSNRDSELTPNLGEPTQSGFEDGTGKFFADFVVNDVMKYVEENYSVYTDREHTFVCGSSSGGLECFYIGMEHPDKFAAIGALSPAFELFDEKTWDKYLKGLEFNGNEPLVYLYGGKTDADDVEKFCCLGAENMPKYLKKISYPSDKVKLFITEGAIHTEKYWRAIFPDFLKYAFAANEKAKGETE